MQSMFIARWRLIGAGLLTWTLAACGGGSDEPSQPPTSPAITVQPMSAAVEPGAAVSFSVTATGTAPLSYQWQRDGNNIAGATSATWSLATTDLADNGTSLRVIVSNALGSTASAPATLTVAVAPSAPRVVVPPQSTRAQDGERVTLSVSAEGTPPLRYQWRRNGANISDATADSLTTPVLSMSDTGASYDVLVSNALGSVASAAAVVTVDPVPARITAEPADVSVVSGQPATFRANAVGSAPLVWQWRRNGVDIPGATSPSFTLASTAESDNGALFSVVARNAAGSSASRAASLSVSAASVAPTIASAPTSLTVDEGASATFNVVAGGTGPLAYQWRRNGIELAGATGESLSLPTTTMADDTARFSVRVSNAAGTAVSNEAVLTVRPLASVLAGRSWTAGQPLEADDNPVRESAVTIDDSGRALVVFGKFNGSRDVIYATRSSAPTSGDPASWSTPEPIDLLAGRAVSRMGTASGRELYLAGSPNGNAVAIWYDLAPCSPTTYSTSGNCRYYYAAQYNGTGASWGAPLLLTDAPDPEFQVSINDRGDIALLGNLRVRGSSGSRTVRTVFMKPVSEVGFRRQLLDGEPIAASRLHLDGAGNLLLAAQYTRAGTTDIAVYRGTVVTGLGSAAFVDNRSAAATLRLSAVGIHGQQALIWTQNNGVSTSTFAAVAETPQDDFAVVDLGFQIRSSLYIHALNVTDEGDVQYFESGFFDRFRRVWRTGTGWSARESMPSNEWDSIEAWAMNRRGDIVSVDRFTGRWSSYDARTNRMIQSRRATPTPWLLGVEPTSAIEFGSTALSQSGVAFVTSINGRDVLPTPSAPAGDGRDIRNLWGFHLR